MVTNEKPSIRMNITVIKVGIRQRVDGKPYERMDFIGKTDKSGEKEIAFVTFKSDVMDSVYEGNIFPADVVVETYQGKTESVIQKIYLPDSKDVSERAQMAVLVVSEMLCSGVVVVPDNIKTNHFNLIEKWQHEALK